MEHDHEIREDHQDGFDRRIPRRKPRVDSGMNSISLKHRRQRKTHSHTDWSTEVDQEDFICPFWGGDLQLPRPSQLPEDLRTTSNAVASDGCGRIGWKLAERVAKLVGLDYVPSLFQARVGCCKARPVILPAEEKGGVQGGFGSFLQAGGVSELRV